MNEYGFPSNNIQEATQNIGSSFDGILQTAQVIGYVLSFILAAFLIYFFIKLFDLKDQIKEKFEGHFIQPEKKQLKNPRREHWGKIASTISKSTDPQLWQLAIIDMDIMLEEAIDERFGARRESFGDKLKQFDRTRSPWIDAVWEVHRLRNVLAHEGTRYPLNQREAFRAYKISENILNEFGYFG